jgi:tetratricopeptide (TPR) repeat protein
VQPVGAEVLLDAELVGHTPLRLSHVPAGTHELIIRKTNFESYAKRIDIQPGRELTFSGFELKDKILEMLANQVKNEPQRAAHYCDLGHYLFVNDKFNEAVEAFVKGLETLHKPLDFDGPGYNGKENMSPQELKLEQRLRLEDEGRFNKDLDKYRQWPGKDTRTFRLKLAEAQAVLSRQDQSSWGRTEMAGREQMRNRSYERAAQLYRDFIAAAPQSPDLPQAYIGLLEVYCMQGDMNKAAEAFDQFYARCEQDGPMLRKCGHTLFPYWERMKDKNARQRVLQLAEKALRRGAQLNGEAEANAQALFDLGAVLLYQNRATDAVPVLRQAVAATANKQTGEDRALRLGDALRKAGDLKGAKEAFTKLSTSDRAGIREKARNGLIFVNTDENRKK